MIPTVKWLVGVIAVLALVILYLITQGGVLTDPCVTRDALQRQYADDQPIDPSKGFRQLLEPQTFQIDLLPEKERRQYDQAFYRCARSLQN